MREARSTAWLSTPERRLDLATKGRVLVVDDDASLAEMLTIVLRQEGFDAASR